MAEPQSCANCSYSREAEPIDRGLVEIGQPTTVLVCKLNPPTSIVVMDPERGSAGLIGIRAPLPPGEWCGQWTAEGRGLKEGENGG